MPKFRAQFTDAERKSFGRLLRKLMSDQSLNGAELARMASRQLGGDKVVGRDMISHYLTGRSIPTPSVLQALAKALKTETRFLLPRDHAQAPGEIAEPLSNSGRVVQMAMRGDNTMDMTLSVNVSKKIAFQILQLIDEDDPNTSTPAKPC